MHRSEPFREAKHALLRRQLLAQDEPIKTPPPLAVDPRRHLPVCEACTGCSHELKSLVKQVDHFGLRFKLNHGASKAFILSAKTPKAADGVGIVKVWCMPIDKEGRASTSCELGSVDRYATKLAALDRLVDDCGMRGLMSPMWPEHIDAIIPDVGYVVNGSGLFTNIARGVPLHTLTFATPEDRRGRMLDLFRRLNGTAILSAAIFDLLTCQCDRHADNVFVSDGGITLIDNDQMLGTSWRRCAADSIFLPTTQKHEINVHGFFWTMRSRFPDARPKGYPNPQLMFDYRCHVEGGELGTRYPPQVSQCLRRLAGMDVLQVSDHYGFNTKEAGMLKMRAHDMLARGFEWTLEHGQPLNPPSLRYKPQPPCCSMTHVRKDVFVCDTPWEPTLDNGTKLEWRRPPGR